VLGPQSTTLNEERKCVVAELDKVPAATGVIALHPAVLARYEEQLNQLQTGLAKGIVAGDSESSEAMQDLIETVTVFRDPSRIGGIEVEIAGRHTALLGENAFPNGVKGVWGKVVEGRELQSNILRAPAKPAGGSTSTRCASNTASPTPSLLERISSSPCQPWRADHFGFAGERGDPRRQLTTSRDAIEGQRKLCDRARLGPKRHTPWPATVRL
jgi:hypothetical protein